MRILGSKPILFALVIIILISTYILNLNEVWVVGGLLVLGWLFLTGLADNIVSRLSNKSNNTDQKYELSSFHDALANEVMRLRTELTGIKIKQDNNLGWDKIPSAFLQMFLMYCVYPSCFLCTYLETPEEYPDPNKYQGMIIVVLDNDINIDHFWEIKFDAESLIKLNSRMTNANQIKSGMSISVYICEENNDNDSTFVRSAKVLSIKEDDWHESIFVTLEIDLDTVLDDLYWRPEESIGKNKIIRKFRIDTFPSNEHSRCFVVDEKAMQNEK